jgi:pimeloyl-ACP methyl ester carboxylesterase
VVSITPDFLLFVQHGWADDNRAMIALAHQLVDASTRIIAPNLGYIQTWIRIAPFIQTVEAAVQDNMEQYPDVPLKIIGHSMGGLIWLEVLHRHPEWWPNVHSIVLVASPVGGADLGRMIDPFNLGIGIASDLGQNRKPIAETIAATIPTLVIAGDYDQGSDGTVPIACTQFSHARFICLNDLSHPALRNHPLVAAVIRDFWDNFNIDIPLQLHEIIQRIQSIPGITDGHWRGFQQAQPIITLPDGSTLRIWKNWAGIDHIFVADAAGQCLYAGFVGWLHSADLRDALREIQKEYASN